MKTKLDIEAKLKSGLQVKVKDLVAKLKYAVDETQAKAGDQKELLTKRIQSHEQSYDELEQKMLKLTQDKINLEAENNEKDAKIKEISQKW